MDNRLPLYQNIMLSGGTTMLPGLATRLERDIRDLYLKHILKVLKFRHKIACLPIANLQDAPQQPKRERTMGKLWAVQAQIGRGSWTVVHCRVTRRSMQLQPVHTASMRGHRVCVIMPYLLQRAVHMQSKVA